MSESLTKKQALDALTAIQPPNDLIEPIIKRITEDVTNDDDEIKDGTLIEDYKAAIEKGAGGGAGADGAGGDAKPPPSNVDAEGFTETDGYKIKKEEDVIKNKVDGATEAYRVRKEEKEYLVFTGKTSNPMIGGQKNSKSQKRGGKKQRQTKRKMGGRRRSNRRR
jgi:hypothetical protein